MKTAIVIPARMGSTRFPGKPLCDLVGKPMVQWVAEAAQQAGFADRVIVATPDKEIADRCGEFGVEAILTRHEHATGTDRVAEVARVVDAEVLVNVQGDEPLIRPEAIATCVQPLLDDPTIQMASIYCVCEPSEYGVPTVVKVVTDHNGFALYFSRYAIPFPRTERTAPVKKHLGVYAFRRKALQSFSSWSQTPLEVAESLEQLRFLENGIKIRMSETEPTELAVDTPEQAEQVRILLRKRLARVLT